MQAVHSRMSRSFLVALATVAVLYLPFAVALRPDGWPPASSTWAVVGLAVLCTGIAFLVFFAQSLIQQYI